MPLLKVENIRKSFGGLTAVEDVSFELDEGEILGIIGPNGAGKTTLFDVITGALDHDAGQIKFDGEDIGVLPTYERVNRGIGRTYQTPKQFSEMTVVENVRACMLPNSLSVAQSSGQHREEAHVILKQVELNEHADASPRELTPGEARRLEIAKALAKRPRLLLLDEVFAGITREEAGDLAALVQTLRDDEGYSFLVIDHVMAVLMSLVDEALVLNFGEKITQGPPEAVVDDSVVKDVYLGESGGVV